MITPLQLIEMQARLAPKTRQPVPDDAVEEEIPLHGEIMKWCKDNRVAYIHARTDKRSRITTGAPDFTIFYRQRVYLIECKTRTEKRRPDQIAWGLQAEMNGFKVNECRSFSEFLNIVNNALA